MAKAPLSRPRKPDRFTWRLSTRPKINTERENYVLEKGEGLLHVHINGTITSGQASLGWDEPFVWELLTRSPVCCSGKMQGDPMRHMRTQPDQVESIHLLPFVQRHEQGFVDVCVDVFIFQNWELALAHGLGSHCRWNQFSKAFFPQAAVTVVALSQFLMVPL